MYLFGMNVFAINWKRCLFKEEDIWDKYGKEDENYIHFPKSMNVKELKLGLFFPYISMKKLIRFTIVIYLYIKYINIYKIII